MNIEQRVQTFIHSHGLFTDDSALLVALSGGADSVALLRLLLRLGYRCHAVHCNFHLRGEESQRDEHFVTELCQALGVPCEVVHFDTTSYAAQHKLSIEMAARELRYREFERIRHERSLDAIAVAHHQDDAVETLLLNLIRGAGINGLTGMKVRNGHVVRPLLSLTRQEIIDYLDRLGQPYVTDSTNLTDEYARNKVRNSLLPLMEQINPAAKANIMQAAIHLSEAATIYNKVVDTTTSDFVTQRPDGLDIHIATLLSSDAPRAMLFEVLHPLGFNPSQIADIYRSLSGEAGRQFESPTHTALRDRTHLMVRTKEHAPLSSDVIYTLPAEGTLELPDGTLLRVSRFAPDSTWQVPRRNDVVCLNAAHISQPLHLRHPQSGDRFKPFGMKGYKLLSDFYTDLKLPRTEKPRQWLLCHGDDIVWAVGHRSSEQYRLSSQATEVICIEKLGNL